MKKSHILLFCFLAGSIWAKSQEISYKYGKIADDELKMTTYDKDTSAVAVVLYENGYFSYDYNTTVGFQTTLDLKKKIKILKPEGTNYGDIAIPYYSKNNAEREMVSGIEAIAYNLENGKVVKSKLEKKYIFVEKINDRRNLLKFSIPNVKAGTVIEYKYQITSPFVFNIPDWNTQDNIPVLNSYYEVLVPEYYFFNVDAAKGYERIQVEESNQNQSFASANVNSNSRLLKFTAKDVPALKSEPYVWCLNDFISGVRFEISGTKYPNDFYKPYTNTWKDIEITLKDKTDFGDNMKMSNPYKNEVKAIVAASSSQDEIIEKIYALIKEKIHWDESYSFWGNKAKDAVKNGTGDNGQINMILLSMLKDANIHAYPVLISRRNHGRLPYTHPSLDKLNSFLVAAQTSEEKIYYMDGSAIYGGLNVLPVNLLVDRGWAFNEKQVGDKWVNLTNLTKNQEIIFQKANIDETGLMTCEKTARYTNQIAYKFKSNYFSAKDSAEYLDNYENTNKITIEDYALEGAAAMSNTVNEKMTFTKKYELIGDYVYINPLIFTHFEKNPFTQSERKLPIEFNYPYTYIMTVILNIPENYVVEEIPATLNMSLENNTGKCIYQTTSISDKCLQLNYRFELNQIIFPQTDYDAIREFFGQAATKNTELIVLKKI